MSVIVVGLNHSTAPLELLERVTVPPARLSKALADLRSRPDLDEAVVLSTCMRTEVYATAAICRARRLRNASRCRCC